MSRIVGVVTREYVWLDDMPLAPAADLDTAAPNLWYVHADHLDRPSLYRRCMRKCLGPNANY
ncbi:hypothetical protein V1286_004121 [Bradyrhizobium algeriense]|uniref:Uncharacterized protein n=1 Tax=Bradyrhizobium algeriense TaxID=634784 RepID=A0ABU8BDH5_9BRAD